MSPNQDNHPDSALSLRELNLRVKGAVNTALVGSYWLKAETSDVRVNHTSGHCYLEFVEKNPSCGQLVAKARASVWAKIFCMLKPYFEQETGQAFTSGIMVLVKVTVDFHEVYGYSLTVVDIDPSYTLGDMARRRMEVVRRLKEEGVYTLNKELPFPVLPKHIAVITSPTAAGYGDFINQLEQNQSGYSFVTKLFPALMQGEKTEESIIVALDRIYASVDYFDVVVIIRGGGATSDLNSFDSYLLATNCAQFPIPVVSGIGHERDDTVVDMVAHTRLKTPTAVAEFLIRQMDMAAEELDTLQQDIFSLVTSILSEQKNTLRHLTNHLPIISRGRIDQGRSRLLSLGSKLPASVFSLLTSHTASLNDRQWKIQQLTNRFLTEQNNYLKLTEQFIQMASPDYILKRGYSLTLKEGKIVKHVGDLFPRETFLTRFFDGEIRGTVDEVIKKQ